MFCEWTMHAIEMQLVSHLVLWVKPSALHQGEWKDISVYCEPLLIPSWRAVTFPTRGRFFDLLKKEMEGTGGNRDQRAASLCVFLKMGHRDGQNPSMVRIYRKQVDFSDV